MNLGNLIAASSDASYIIRYTLRQGSSALQGDWISLCTVTDKNTYDPLTGYGTLCLLPNITTIGDLGNAQSPFYGNTDLLEVDFTRSSIKNIGLNALYGCSSLTIATLGKKIQSIGENAIKNCTSLQTITIPGSVTSIGSSAFAFDSALSTVILEAETPPDLGASAFTSIAGSSTLKVPYASLSTYSQSIYSSYFTSVAPIESVIQYTATQKLNNKWINANTIVSKNTFDSQTGKGALILKDNITMIGNDTQTYTGFSPFVSNDYVNTVDLSLSNISTLGYRAFYSCYKLTSIDIGPSVTQILPIAKDKCISVSSLLASGNSTYQASNGFIISGTSIVLGCVVSEKINIPSNITTIASGAFHNVGRYSAYIPESVTSIGDEAFVSAIEINEESHYCYATIPPTLGQGNFNSRYDTLWVQRPSLELYQESSWASCFSTVDSIRGVITYVGPDKINNSWVNTNTTQIYDYSTHTGTLTLNSGDITSFGDSHPFQSYRVTKVDLSKSYFTSLGYNSFYYCSQLREIILPEGLEEISQSSFNYCWSLPSINIPSSVVSIRSNAFYDTPNLNIFVCNALTPPTLDPDIFNRTNDRTLYVPASAVADYEASDWANYFTSILPIS